MLCLILFWMPLTKGNIYQEKAINMPSTLNIILLHNSIGCYLLITHTVMSVY